MLTLDTGHQHPGCGSPTAAACSETIVGVATPEQTQERYMEFLPWKLEDGGAMPSVRPGGTTTELDDAEAQEQEPARSVRPPHCLGARSRDGDRASSADDV